MPPCLTLSIIREGSRVKWSNPGNGVAPSPTPQCSSYWKGIFGITLDKSHGAQCGVTTSHSTCCGYCIRDYHISFRSFALSNLSMPTLCWKDPGRWGWHSSAGSSSDGQVIWVARALRVLILWSFEVLKNCWKFLLFEFFPILETCILKLGLFQAFVNLFFLSLS